MKNSDRVKTSMRDEEITMMNVILTGLNGYGAHFINYLLEDDDNEYRLVGVVSRRPEKSVYYEVLKEKNVHFYSNIEACLEQEEVDLAMITTPMYIHYQEVMAALRHGVSVLCEKPLTPTVEQALEIKELAKKNGCTVAVGFQWSFSDGILNLKKDLLEGKFGKLNQIKTLVNWNRPKRYFEGSDWKGKYYSAEGEGIFDSVLSNCAAHFIHNLLFLAGENLHTSAKVSEFGGECYRAHHIETFDTTSLHIKTTNQQDLFYYATIVSEENELPKFEATCEKAKIYYPVGEAQNIVAVLEDGSEIIYTSPNQNRYDYFKKVIECIKMGKRVPCDVETVIPELALIGEVMKQIEVMNFPKEMILEDEEKIYIKGMSEILDRCYHKELHIGEIIK